MIIIFKMKSLFCGIFLICVSYCLVQLRLSTNGTEVSKSLKANDSIISTLGNFKATLQQSGCSIVVYKFNNVTNSYESQGNYKSSIYTENCSALLIQGGKLVTDSNKLYLQAPNLAYNYSTTFTIDDQGVMRLISTYIMQNMVDIVSTEAAITQFQVNNSLLRAYSQFSVSFSDTFNAIKNQRNWKFIAEFGQLTIYYGQNPAISVDYIFSAFTIRDSRIYDFSNQTFPGALFTNVTFEPRCKQPKTYLDFKPPYVIAANPYWPSVTVYQQGGYKIVDVWLANLAPYTYEQNKTQINYYNFYSPCPKKTFQFRGDCVASCPAPYYHQIKGETGFCVLSCEQYSYVNQTSRVCSCVTDYEWMKLNPTNFVQKCPSDANATPFGCVCTAAGYYYDGLLSFKCVQSCPNATLAINSLCMACPVNCLNCSRDNFNRQFLQCKVCKPNFNLSNGQCIVNCFKNHGYTLINGVCTKCSDPNCVDCTGNVNICLKCNIMNSLRSGACVSNCAAAEESVYGQNFSTTCLPRTDSNCTYYLTSFYNNTPFLKCDECPSGSYAHLDKCVSSCPAGYTAFNAYCTCAGTNNLTINNLCLNQIACPIMTSFDIRSHSCLSCPFGCMSCINTQCTSCNPGYFLYISPQSILCRKKSPLFPCDQQYSWQRNTTCALTNYTDPNLGMTLCYTNVPNCQICFPQSAQICVFCMPNFYIYNNTCIATCPAGLIPYDNTCILPQIKNCSLPHLMSLHQQAIITQNLTQNSQSYKYYIYGNLQMANDPVGYIPYFQQLTTQTNDGIPRETDFFQPTWICLKCNDTFGLSNDFKSCLPCPKECPNQLCYMARNDSCINPFTHACPPNYFLEEGTTNCLQSCNITDKYPYVLNGILYCGSNHQNYGIVDSSVFQMKNGTKLVFFVFGETVTTSKTTTVTVTSMNYTKTSQTTNTTNTTNTTTTTNTSNTSDTPNSQSNTFSTPIIDGQYIQLNNQPYNAFILNLSDSLGNLTGLSQSIAFPNPVYGSVYQADHTVFMTTWLAYIGYIMAIVIILLHAVYIGNQLLYKVDNLLIFVQTIFFFAFVKNLAGRLLAQYYFGWSFAHARFLPNLFDPIIPDGYVETAAPIPYKIFNIDGNYFRNAGFSLAWLLIYILCWAIITFFVWGILNKLCRKHETWYPRVAKQALIAGVQFFSMNLIFFSVSQLAYSTGAWQNGFQDYFGRSQVLAIITLSVFVIYTIARFIYYPLGGLYMIKRVVLAVILVFSYQYHLLILPFIAFQILFAILRWIIERPIYSSEKLFIWGEAFLFIGSYILLYLCIDAGVNSIIISIFVFLFIVYIAYDLTTLYLESKNQFPQEQLVKQYEQVANDPQRAHTLIYIPKKNSPMGSGLNMQTYSHNY